MLVCWGFIHTLKIITRILHETVNKACMLVCLDFIDTLEIITRTLREVVNRERLCGTSTFYFGGLFLFVCFCNKW